MLVWAEIEDGPITHCRATIREGPVCKTAAPASSYSSDVPERWLIFRIPIWLAAAVKPACLRSQIGRACNDDWG
jgi:hypothetical protein